MILRYHLGILTTLAVIMIGKYLLWGPQRQANLNSHIEIFDQTISNRHLHIYAIDYAADAGFAPVAPLVFVEDLSTNGTILERLIDVVEPAVPSPPMKLSRHSGAILLNHGDKLHVSPTDCFEYVFDHDRWKKTPWSTVWATQSEDRAQFVQAYTITKRLVGVGGTSRVHLGYEQKQGTQVACKIIPLDWSAQGKERLLANSSATERLRYHVPEIEFLEELQHVCQRCEKS